MHKHAEIGLVLCKDLIHDAVKSLLRTLGIVAIAGPVLAALCPFTSFARWAFR